MEYDALTQDGTLIYTTVDDITQAKQLAHEAITEGYAACVNIIPNGISVYRWEGKVCQDQECYLLFKTLPSMAQILAEWIMQKHPYATCAVLRIDAKISGSFFDYMDAALKFGR